jgi:tetratricopeptide (TPR) repeat protein
MHAAVMRSTRRTVGMLAAPIALPFAGLLLVAGCAAHTEFGMESPGRPAITWQGETPEASPTPNAQAQKKAEGALLAELHDAEQQGTDELALASTLYNLAILRRQQGRLDEAGQLYRRGLEIRERKQGPNHPDVATILNNLAALEAARGRYDAAQPLLERALTIRSTGLGDEHILTAESMNNLALLYAAQGNATAAEPLYQRAIAVLEKAGGSGTGELDRVLDNYAALLYDTGRDTKAQAIEARARVIRAVPGPSPGPGQ